MTGPVAPPSINPVNQNNMPGVFQQVLRKFLQNVDDMLPAEVISYDRAAKRATVKPLVRVISTAGTVFSRAQVASVPVLQLGGGNVVLDFNLVPGDLGYIKANDRDISLFLQSYKESPPNTYRKHSFEDAVFIPAPMHGYSIDADDTGAAVLQTLDGTQRIVVYPDKIKIFSNTEIIIDSPLTTFTGAVRGTSERATSDATFDGTIHATVDVTGQTISLVHHVHSGVQSGPDDTGTPVP